MKVKKHLALSINIVCIGRHKFESINFNGFFTLVPSYFGNSFVCCFFEDNLYKAVDCLSS
jgi:hypothetical protein